MIPVLLLNLDRSRDRLHHMAHEFAKVGVAFERVEGIDSSEWSTEERSAWIEARPKFAAGQWRVGDIGNFCSHYKAWQNIASNYAAAAAVFEDDVFLASDLAAILANADWLPADADIVRLEANSKMVLTERRRLAFAPGRSLYRAASGTWGAAGYIIRKKAAMTLLEAPLNEHVFTDSFLFKPTRSSVAASLRCYQIFPALCIQDDYLNGRSARLQNVFGAEVRTVSAPPRPRWLDGLLPWRKRAVPFKP